MSENINAPLSENEHVRELVSVLQENHVDANTLVAMLGYVAAVEKQLDKAAGELASMRRELNVMREERNHPIRTALVRAISSLENSIAIVRSRLEGIKAAIVTGCKNAVAAFKQHGISALNNLARFFNLKTELRDWSKSLNNLMKANDKTVENIEAMSAEYHAAGLHVKNAARVLVGKEPLREIRRNGRLARLMEAPFVTVRRFRQYAKDGIDRAAEALERLEHTAPERIKPSIVAEISKYKDIAAQAEREAPDRARTQGRTEAVL